MTGLKPALTILLVEDNPADAALARLALEEAGIDAEVQVADLLQTALTYLETAAPDVILLDLGLPDVSGLDGVGAIERQAPLAPVIVLSGLRNQETAHAALESGAQDYLVKGEYLPELLARSIRYAIERKRSERELLQAARFDAVTGLFNRSYFLGLLDHALDRAKRNGTVVSVLFLDLDHFKNINDSLGHAAGDALLREVGERLRQCVRKSDVVARLGGDEFTVMVEDVESASAAAVVANKILAAMRPGFSIEGVDVIVTPSIGIARFPDAGQDVQTLLQHADTAMYRAKSLGRNTVEFFTDAMNKSVRESFELEMALRRAQQQNEFELHYQPIVDCVTGGVIAIEALLRWRPEDGDELIGKGQP